MANFLLLAVCFVTGVLLRRTKRVPENASAVVNEIIIYFSFPAMVLLHVHSLPLTSRLLGPALMPWLVLLGAIALFVSAGRLFGWSRRVVGCLILTCGLGNTSFVGLPMIEALFGREHLGIGVVCDQAGSFAALSTLGIVAASVLSGRGFTAMGLARRVILFPPFLAVLLALALKPFAYPEVFVSMLEKIGATLAPLALLSVGLTIRLGALREYGRIPALGLAYKTALAPLCILALYAGLLGQTDATAQVTVFEAAMPPMITGGVVAMQYDLEPELAGLLLGVGIPLSFVLLPVWAQVLRAL